MATITRPSPTQWAAEITQEGYLSLDTETSGFLDDPASEILSIAIVDSHGEVLLSTYVKPVRAIDEEGGAFRVNGISNAMVANSPSWPEVWEVACEILRRRVVVIYNVQFDLPMMAKQCQRFGCAESPGLIATYSCAMMWYAEHAGIRDFKPGRTYKWHKLGDACAAMKVVTRPDHSACADALATVELIRAMAEIETMKMQKAEAMLGGLFA